MYSSARHDCGTSEARYRIKGKSGTASVYKTYVNSLSFPTINIFSQQFKMMRVKANTKYNVAVEKYKDYGRKSKLTVDWTIG